MLLFNHSLTSGRGASPYLKAQVLSQNNKHRAHHLDTFKRRGLLCGSTFHAHIVLDKNEYLYKLELERSSTIDRVWGCLLNLVGAFKRANNEFSSIESLSVILRNKLILASPWRSSKDCHPSRLRSSVPVSV